MTKIYLKAICLKNHPNRFRIDHYFTTNKTYNFYKYRNAINGETYYKIINDKNKMIPFREWQFKNSFKLLEEIRNEKLESILG